MPFTSSANRKASSLIIFQRDRTAFQWFCWAGMLLFVMLLFLGLNIAIGRDSGWDSASIWKIGAGAVFGMVLAIAIAILGLNRIRTIRQTVDSGHRLEAEVTEVWYSLPWPLSKELKAIITYKYVFSGQPYSYRAELVRRQETLGFEPGMKIVVAVDQNRPDEAYIVETFLEPKKYG